MKLLKQTLKYMLIGLLFFSSCKKDNKKAGENNGIFHEEELITTVELILYDSSKNTLDTAAFRDVDGIGGIMPTVDSIYLMKNSLYSVEIRFLDESNPDEVEEITHEIERESDEHIICYEAENLAMQIEPTDSDGNYPLGLKSNWRTDSTAQFQNGTIQIRLKHQVGVKDGSCEAGDTDVEVDFPAFIR